MVLHVKFNFAKINFYSIVSLIFSKCNPINKDNKLSFLLFLIKKTTAEYALNKFAYYYTKLTILFIIITGKK